MSRLEKIGAFALTEPWIGSDASHIMTMASREGDTYVINGAKRWIGIASFADVTIVWAIDEEIGQVSSFLVEKGTPGLEAALVGGKISKSALLNADIKLTNCVVPAANRLANANRFKF